MQQLRTELPWLQPEAERWREAVITYRFAWAFTSTTGNGWGSTVVTVPGLMTEAVFKECEALIRERNHGLHITILSWQPFENEPASGE